MATDEIATETIGGEPKRAPVARLAHALPQPGTTLGHYELIRELGHGGMGAVYLARDTRLARRVAIKLMFYGNESRVKRFLAEARVTARCRHDNIVVIYDVVEEPGCSYMVLEYIEGMTLRAWLRDRWQPSLTSGIAASSERASVLPELYQFNEARVSPTWAVELMVPVVRALAHAHRHSLVHRDLKPENIMLTHTGSIKVLDFGIVKVLGREAAHSAASDWASEMYDVDPSSIWEERGAFTREGTLVGTKPYMSPEQWGADEIDVRTDIWAVGIILWELVTGRHPLEPLSGVKLRSVRDVSQPMPSLSEQRPDLMPLAGIIDRCLRKPKGERIPSAQALLAELEPLLPGRSSLVPSEAGKLANPYAGLAAFQEEDAGRFFGRERDVAGMVAQLRNYPIVAVAGASGAGKSSFVRAGVIPALKRSGQKWESFIIRPGREALAALASVLAHIGRSCTQLPGQESESPEAEAFRRNLLISTLRVHPGHLGAVLRARSHQRRAQILLFVDQFEELYTLGTDRPTRQAFVQCLEGVADDASSRLRVVLSLRSDFLDRVAEDRSFTSEITRALLLLPNLGRPELREALVRPVEALGHAFESEELIASMLDTLEATRAPLPLLQFTAAKLWESRDRERRLLTRASYEALGGVAGALAVHADAVLAGLSAREHSLARVVFTSLVTEERTSAIVSLAELCAMAPVTAASDSSEDPGKAMAGVVQHLAQARLLLVDTDADREGQTVEISHESLIDKWPRLHRWLAEDEEAAAFRVRLRAAAKEWDKRGRSEDLLWRGQAAEEAARWLERSTRGEGDPGGSAAMAELLPRDRDYLHAVVELTTRARRRRRQGRGALIASLSAVVLVVSLLALRASREAKRAEEQAARAEEQAVRAEREFIQARNAGRMAAAREQQFDPTLVLALVREIDPSQPPQRWKDLARWALHQAIARAVLTHPDVVFGAAFSPDGKRIATACLDRSVRVWNADGTGQPVVLTGHLNRIVSVVFSPDGKRIVTASVDQTARVWNADGTGEPLVLTGHLDHVYSAVFSPDGKRIVTAARDRTARVWNADGTGEPLVLTGHLAAVKSVDFSPDGKRIVTGSTDKTVRVWNADGTGEPLVLTAHLAAISSVDFSPDGKRIVTAAQDRTARVWNADGTGQPLVLTGHLADVNSAAFSPDGKRIVTASGDKTARVWNADGTGQPVVLSGHLDPINSAAFSPDGKRIVTASWDKTARVWNADRTGQPVVLSGHLDVIYSAAFSPDGKRIVTASADRTARVWNADGTGQPIVLSGHLAHVHSAAFSPDGKRIVTASADRTARVWNADGTGQPIVLSGHQATIYSAAFSPDGKRIVTASTDRTGRVWNADGTGQPIVLSGHLNALESAAFSPDGKRIVTASADGTARVWNADGTGQPIVLSGHLDIIYSAAFSPDGKRIVTASWDKTARVWNADGTGQPIVLSGHEAALGTGASGGQGAFSPDGKRIVTVSVDKTIRIWNIDGGGEPEILRAPDVDAYSAAFSPDGKRIVSASHEGHTARVWPESAPIADPYDPVLWLATTYCPPVKLRLELLGVPEHIARRDLADCQRRVEKARAGVTSTGRLPGQGSP